MGSYQSITRIKGALKLALPFFLPVLQLLAQNNQQGRVPVSRNKGGQDIKGLWWMSWRQEPMKDVAWLR